MVAIVMTTVLMAMNLEESLMMMVVLVVRNQQEMVFVVVVPKEFVTMEAVLMSLEEFVQLAELMLN